MKKFTTAILLAAILLASCGVVSQARSTPSPNTTRTPVVSADDGLLVISQGIAGIACVEEFADQIDAENTVSDACFNVVRLIEIRNERYWLPGPLGDTGLRAPEDVHDLWPLIFDEIIS